MIMGIDVCSSWMLFLHWYESSDEELMVHPRLTKVIITCDNWTKLASGV